MTEFKGFFSLKKKAYKRAVNGRRCYDVAGVAVFVKARYGVGYVSIVFGERLAAG